jgi:CheY-like chemotaxis protein
MTLVAEELNLPGLLQDTYDLMKPQFDEKQLELVSRIEEGAPDSIVSDGEKIRQILINFLSNSVKFTRHGGATISLQAGTDNAVCLRVTDTGIGIPADKHDLVFEAFKQADGSTSRRFGGTGLGLTISRELARLMGGDIQVESEPDKGTSFSLLLPLQMPASPAEVQPGSKSASQEKPTGELIPAADYQGARVLLVDDDMRNLLALTPLLEQWHLDVMAAGDADEALETLASAGRFDVVLMDIMMPGMDGYEAIRAIRAKSQFQDMPVVALTAKAGDDDRQNCLSAGANDTVVKPVEPLALKQVLDSCLIDNRPQG